MVITEIDSPIYTMGSKYKVPLGERIARILPNSIAPTYEQLELASQIFEVVGIDTSYWNGIQDGSITRLKAQFQFIRLGFGNKGIDSAATAFASQCETWGIEYGMYWFVKVLSTTNWKDHASMFSTLWKDMPGKLPPVLDCESTVLGKEATSGWLYKLVREFQDITGISPMIYTSAGWWNSNVARNDWAKQLQLMVAHWTTMLSPTIPWDWGAINNPKEYTFWQHNAEGNGLASEYGFTNGDDDIDRQRYHFKIPTFNLSYGTNISPLGEPPPPPPPPPGEDNALRMKVVVDSLNVRAGTSLVSPIVGRLVKGETVNVINVTGTNAWGEIEPGKYACIQNTAGKYMTPDTE